MKKRNFQHILERQWARKNFVCIGLDSEFDKIPDCIKKGGKKHKDVFHVLVDFNRAIIDATKHLVCAYKPNSAFYERYGSEGVAALRMTIKHIHDVAPDVPVILDAKRGDIGNTNDGYVSFAFDVLQADAITVSPYLGYDSLKPFLEKADKGIIILCRTSNPGSGEFQIGAKNGDQALYQFVAERVAKHWNANGNCSLVVGATYPNELKTVRQIVGDMPILIPGIGAQGGNLEKTVLAGKNSLNQGMIINSSRGIIFASPKEDFADAALLETEKLRNLINQLLQKE